MTGAGACGEADGQDNPFDEGLEDGFYIMKFV